MGREGCSVKGRRMPAATPLTRPNGTPWDLAGGRGARGTLPPIPNQKAVEDATFPEIRLNGCIPTKLSECTERRRFFPLHLVFLVLTFYPPFPLVVWG